jgi:hypothetical protein
MPSLILSITSYLMIRNRLKRNDVQAWLESILKTLLYHPDLFLCGLKYPLEDCCGRLACCRPFRRNEVQLLTKPPSASGVRILPQP